MDAGTLELILLYVLSAIATFWFLRHWAKMHYRKFRTAYYVVAALVWPVFFAYQVIREFSK